MKRLAIAFALFLLTAVTQCIAQNAAETTLDTSLYYYYKGDKIFLERVSDKILVKFNDGVTGRQAWDLLRSVGKFIEPEDTENSLTYGLIVLETAFATSQPELDTMIARVHRNAMVSYASPLMKVSGKATDQFLAVSDRIVLRLKEGATGIDAAARIVDLSKVSSWEDGILKNRYIGTLLKEKPLFALQYAKELVASGAFEYVDPGFIGYGNFFSSNYQGDQWALNHTPQHGGITGADINVNDAWQLGFSGAGIRVAVVDDGVSLVHPEFNGRILSGYDVVGTTSGGPEFNSAHGTACAGIIAAANDGVGTVGVAPASLLIPVRISSLPNFNACSGAGIIDYPSIASAINWAWNNAGADVVNLSWKTNETNDIAASIYNGILNGRNSKGTLFVAASGNTDNAPPNLPVDFPARLDFVIATGATNLSDERLIFSNYASGIDVVAPGVLISTTDLPGPEGYNGNCPDGLNFPNGVETYGQNYTSGFLGTSAAAPFAAGTLALILEANPNLLATQARYVLESTCDKVRPDLYDYNTTMPNGESWNTEVGYGRINAGRAVEKVIYNSFCPDFDFPIVPSTTWQTHQSIIYDDYWSLYRFTATAGETYEFKTCCGDGASSDFSATLELSDESCDFITNGSSQLTWTANYSGNVYLKIQPSSGDGQYTMAYRRVTQPPTPCTISLSPSSASTASGYNAGSNTFTVNATGSWSITPPNCDWIIGMGPLSGFGTENVTVYYSGNTSLSSRQCDFSVSCGASSATYSLVQAGPQLSMGSPSNGASVSCTSGVNFSWSSNVSPVEYRIQVSTVNDWNPETGFSNPIVSVNTGSNAFFNWPSASSNTTYYWTVHVYDAQTYLTSDYTQPRSFSTGNCGTGGGGCTGTPTISWVSPVPPSPPPAVQFSAAICGCEGNQIELYWANNSNCPSSLYEVELTSPSGGGQPPGLDYTSSSSYVMPFNSDFSGSVTLNFRVRGQNSNGWGAWSETVSIYVVSCTSYHCGGMVCNDPYEPNEDPGSAYDVNPIFQNDNFFYKTNGACTGNGEIDPQDYYSVTLPSGYNYTITSRLQDIYSNNDGVIYTGDMWYTFATSQTGQWASWEDIEHSAFTLNGGGTIYFAVDNYGADNSYAGTYALQFNISRVEQPKPDLQPYALNGWSSPLLISNTSGYYGTSSSFNTNQNIYVHAGMFNNSPTGCDPFNVRIYRNNQLITTSSINSGLPSYTPTTVLDVSAGFLTAGYHEFRLVVDASSQVTESNEYNNEYSQVIYVEQALPNLRPYTPSGWSAPLIVATTNGTFTDAPTIYDTQDIYVDMRAINDGSADATVFNCKLYLDQTLINTHIVSGGLQVGYTAAYNDLSILQLSAGTHELKLVVDADGQVAESNEFDNIYIKNINVLCTPIAQPSAITGSGQVCQNQSVTYSVSAVAGVTYSWSVTGGYIVSGQGTNQIQVNFTSSGNRSVVVSPLGSCGQGPSRSKNIQVYPSIPVTQLSETICAGSQFEGYSVTGTYTDTFSSINGCDSVRVLNLNVLPGFDPSWQLQTSASDNFWTSVTYGNGLFVSVGLSGAGDRVMTSTDGANWTVRNSAADNHWSSVTFGNGLFVAVAFSGSGNRVMTSADGINWTLRNSAADYDWESVTFGNGLFVAVASSGTGNRVMTSPDGINWTLRSSAADRLWRSVVFGNGLFVAVASSGTGTRVMTSPDGINWTLRNSAADNLWYSVAYGNGLFVAVAGSGTGNRVMTSPNGINWTLRNSAADNNWGDVIFGNGIFVAVSNSGTGNRVMTSQNGINWTIGVSPADNNWTGIANGGGIFVAVAYSGAGNRVMTSNISVSGVDTQTSCGDFIWIDGNTYSQSNNTATFTLATTTGCDSLVTLDLTVYPVSTTTINQSICAGDSFYGYNVSGVYTDTIVTQHGCDSIRILNLTVSSTYTSSVYETICEGMEFEGYSISGIYTDTSYTVSGCDSVRVLNLSVEPGSSDSWHLQLSAADKYWKSIAFGNGLFVAVSSNGSSNNVMTSSDGANWTLRTSPTNQTWNSVCFGNGIFVAVGTGGGVMTSPDGINWNSQTAAAANNWQSVTYGNGKFVAVAGSGTSNRAMTSPDGVNWTSQVTPNKIYYSLTYGNGMFVAVSGLDVFGIHALTSPDGINWTTRSAPTNRNWISVAYGNGLFVAVANSGTGNRIMTSPDGINWTTRTSPSDNNWASVTFGNDRFIAVANSGTGNRVMSSSDGINWTLGVSAADNNWESVVYGDGLLVAVGSTGSGNRVMTSHLSSPIVDTHTSCGPFTWVDGITYSQNNSTATHTLTSTFGCDSLVQLNLTVISPSSTSFSQTICAGDSYEGYSTSGTYTDVFTAQNGCDSVRTVNLIVLQPLYSSISQSICYGSSYEGYTATGTYVDNLNSSYGCDSIRTLNLTINQASQLLWEEQTSPTDHYWRSVAFGNGIFVAVSSSGTGNRVMTSPDGMNWTLRNSAADNGWSEVTFGNGLFVVIAYNGMGNRVMTSPDGINWTIRATPADYVWNGIAFGNGLFVAVSSTGSGNRVMTSPDGTIWTLQNTPADNNWFDVVYANGLFVAVAGSGTGNRVMTSPDGINWTLRTSAANYSWTSITYGNGLYVAVAVNGGNNGVMTSPDGMNWTLRSSASNYTWSDVTFGDGLFVAVANSGSGNRAMWSLDGITWTLMHTPFDNNWSSITQGNNRFVAVSNSGVGNRVMIAEFRSRTADVHQSCSDFTWIDGITYTQSNNTATHTLISSLGCDSLVALALTIQSAVTSTVTQSICAGDSYLGYSATGVFTDTLTAQNGCDSIRTLDLTVMPSITSTVTQSICDGDVYLGYSTTGIYTDSFTAQNGCDSTRTFDLTVLPTITSTVTQSICNGQSYLGYTTTGIYTDTFTAQNGCDSTRTLDLTVLPTITSTVTQTICAGQSFEGYTATGIYTDTFTAQGGCDSTRTLDLTVLPAIIYTVTQTVCAGQSFEGYTATGIYTDTFTAQGGCDSTRTLHLTVVPAITTTITQSICNGQSYLGYSATGVYTDAFTSQSGCDSTRTLNLTVLPAITSTVTQSICDGQNYLGYSATGIYTDTFAAQNGCDSTRTLDLTVMPAITSTLTQNICNGQNYLGYTATGIYTNTFTAQNGCDSTRTLNLTVLPPITSTVTQSICNGQSYLGYSATGIYTDTFTAQNGCDSIRTLDLTVLPAIGSTVTLSICNGQSYLGYAATGVYTDTFTAQNGCDSTRTLNLTVVPNITSTITQIICIGQSYLGYSTTGIYTDTFTAQGGCDSIRTLDLTVLPSITSTVTQSICDGDAYLGYSTTGIYTDSFTAQGGCDSTRTLDLTVMPGIISTVTQSICNGQSYLGYSATGIYTDTFTAQNGCDSTRTLDLTVLPAITSTVTQSICIGQNYLGYSASGIYNDTFTAQNGCDSTRTLNLTVLPPITSTVTQSICNGQNYLGYAATGIYTNTFTAQNGCDSTRTLDLTVLPAITSTVTQSICTGQSFEGYSATGVYTDTFTAQNGCDSIRTLDLTVLPTITSTVTQTVCDGDTYLGYSTTGIYTDNFTAQGGCDSTRTLDLTVLPEITSNVTQSICDGESYLGYAATGTYSDTFIAANSCDSTRTLDLTVEPLPSLPTITDQGNYLESSYPTGNQWYLDGDSLLGETGQWLNNPAAGEYTVEYTDVNGCSSLSDAYQVVVSNIIGQNDEFLFEVFPNPNSGSFIVVINGASEAALSLIDVRGRVISTSRMSNKSERISFEFNGVSSGVYILEVTTIQSKFVKRVVVN